MPRRVICLAFVAAIIGCSYDWTIGSESVPGPIGSSPPTPQPPADAGGARGGGARDASADTGAGNPKTNGECGPTCSCQDRNKCDFTCSTGRCALTCTERSECTIKCAPNSQCDVTCEDDATCNMDCSAGQANCAFTCDDDAECRGSCRNLSVCLLECSRRCNVDCSGGGLCTET